MFDFMIINVSPLSGQIRFLGGKLGVAMAKEYEVATVGDLLCVLFFVPALLLR